VTKAAPALIPLTVPEVRRLVLALNETPERQAFRLHWSHWRRAHQAGAQRCHQARQHRGALRYIARTAPVPLPLATELSDSAWERVRPLLPPQRPCVGRPRHDHRTILAGILWVLRTDAPWRALPTRFGHYSTVYKRYRLWCDQGLWPRLVRALDGHAQDGP
jgi:hypothetical protein